MRGTTRTVRRLRPCPPLLCSPQVAAAATAATPRPRQLAPRRAAVITVRGCNPQNPLVPSNTTETCGGNVHRRSFAKLVHYNAETAKPENDIAESIETTDNQNFTIKLKPYKFHDGTEVNSKNFVDAWNYAAYGPNAQSSGYFMEPIEGFADLQCAGTTNPDDPCEGYTPKAKEMSGLKVVKDDKTFTIKTTEKVSNLPVRLGYSAFAPLPEAFFKDPKAFGDKPIGTGPYKVDSWTKEQADRPVEVRRLLRQVRWQASTRSPSRSTRTPTPPTTTSSPTTSTSPTRSRRAP